MSRTKPGTVVASLESGDGTRCIDLFKRDDGTFGFEEYRRDPEDPYGWRDAGYFLTDVYPSQEAAHAAALGV